MEFVVTDDGPGLSEDELVANAILLLNAGHEASVNVVGNGVRALLVHRAQWRRLVDDPALVQAAAEEVIRYDTPLSLFQRTAFDDVEVGGRTIRDGERVGLLLGSANRDPRVFADPDRLDVGRWPNPHVGFGGPGPHYCLGAHLARREITVMYRELFTRLPGIRSVGEPDFPTPDHVKLSAKKALDANFTKYTPSPGIPELRDAIAEKSKKDNGIPCESGHVLVTPTKLALFNSVMTLVNPGDEVLLLAPYWTTYPESIKLAGAVPVQVTADESTGYLVTVEQLEAAGMPVYVFEPRTVRDGIDLLWRVADLPALYLAGVAFVAMLLIYEQSLVSHDDLSQVKKAFDLNGYVGIVYFAATALALYIE